MRRAARHTTFMVSCNTRCSPISSLPFLYYYPYCLLLISLLHIALGPTEKHYFELIDMLFIYIHFRFSPLPYCPPLLERGVTSTFSPKPVKDEALAGRMFFITFFIFNKHFVSFCISHIYYCPYLITETAASI